MRVERRQPIYVGSEEGDVMHVVDESHAPRLHLVCRSWYAESIVENQEDADNRRHAMRDDNRRRLPREDHDLCSTRRYDHATARRRASTSLAVRATA